MNSMKEMKIGVLGATLETPNLGVSTLAAGAVSCILHAFPHAQIFFLDYGRQPTIQTLVAGPLPARVPLVNLRFSWRFWLPNHILTLLLAAIVIKIAPRSIARWMKTRNRWLAQICSADLFTAVSGGDSFSDIYGWIRFLYVALPQILVILLGGSLALLPQTYGPFRSRTARMVARWIVSRAECSWCRDRNSLAKLMRVHVSHPQWGESAFAYDLAFALQLTRPTSISIDGLKMPYPESELIGVNVSGLLFQGGYTGRNEFGLRVNYRRLQHAIIRRLLSHSHTRVLLVPHVSGPGCNAEDDLSACEQIYAALRGSYPGRIGILRGTYSPGEMRSILGLCSFFVGSRMHACIGALTESVPAVAVAYSDKFSGVMASLDLDDLVADARKLSGKQILAVVENSWKTRGEIAERLERTIPTIQAATWNLLTALKRVSTAQPELLAAHS